MASVIFHEHITASGEIVGEIRLNAEKKLNALTLKMIDLISAKLDAWQSKKNLVAILLDSEGEKAFCAGGDIIKLHEAMMRDEISPFPTDFFTREYQLDYQIHTYPKPIICWGSGFVMGGGMGLFAGASHRVVTQTSYLAMPEVSIGLYPDVGASYFLNKLPGNIGLFLGLTAAGINAKDAMALGMADYALDSNQRAELLERLLLADWQANHHEAVNKTLSSLSVESHAVFDVLPSPIMSHQGLIEDLMSNDSLSDMLTDLANIETEEKWLMKAQNTVANGSPVSLVLIKTQLERSVDLTLKEVFQQELEVSVQCTRHEELAEGVRALLIDKDKAPKWRYDSVAAVEDTYIEDLLSSPWDKADHPLRYL
ncbi:enoyl-CoA hydratase/isomerase family protein [Marinomonas sp. MED121]|uniref:enoyl-CoA hydratase/isomerase family protein n=1 Tax=Marinomonas sp. MED121 TaxID=314277 RepID=UPI0000690B81|nr:enoyl-CoA hydratase/isomerase family protein [Marinomonas sp. MED121]EAQ66022.1 enoyl-CoA hydratase/isomerase family protein [Marinomonas sp. MED121]